MNHDLSAQGAFLSAVAVSTIIDTTEAASEVISMLAKIRSCPPDFVSVHFNTRHDASVLWTALRSNLATKALHGASSCRGVMTNAGSLNSADTSVGAFAIWDKAGNYGTGFALVGEQARSAAREATITSLCNAGRPGEAPDLVWISSSPGHEEEILLGIKDVLGDKVLIAGGSAADNDVSGQWSVFSNAQTSQNAVVVSVIFSSVPLACSFESGYAPTKHQGIVTQAEGRRISQIGGRPAAEVYEDWTNVSVRSTDGAPRAILMETCLSPIGRRDYAIDNIPYYLVAHPATAYSDGSIEFFVNIPVGTEICLMEGSISSLVERSGNIARDSRARLMYSPVCAALVVYCAGCMLSVKDQMGYVVDQIDKELGNAPFLGIFTFGEQGETLSGSSEHANLMISCVTFGRPDCLL